MTDKIEIYLRELIDERFPEGQRNSAYIYCIAMLQLIHGDYIAVNDHLVMSNFLPTGDKRLTQLMRVVADLIDRLRTDEENKVKDIVNELKKQILKEME